MLMIYKMHSFFPTCLLSVLLFGKNLYTLIFVVGVAAGFLVIQLLFCLVLVLVLPTIHPLFNLIVSSGPCLTISCKRLGYA